MVDTTVRLVSQQPLAGNASTATVLAVAELLDGAGFAGLEVSGGGCFDAAVRRGVESPWDRIRALKARCTRTPLQIAVRGRFLVGSRPVSDDLVRRFILSAAESGIDVFRLHDPLNDVENLVPAAAAVREAGGRLYGGLAFSGHMGNLERVVEKARRLADLGAERVLLHDSAGALDPGVCGTVLERLADAAGVPAGLYCQGTGGKALAMAIEAARHGADPIAVAAYPVASLLNRVAAEVLGEALASLEFEHGVDVERIWEASRFIDAELTSKMPALPVPPRIILRTAITRLPVGLVAEIDARLRSADALDRLDEVLTELNAVRADCGTAPLAAPIGGILAGQAVTHVLTARRWAEVSDEMRALLSGAYGEPPLPFAAEAAAHATEMPSEPDIDMADLRSQSGGAGSEEDLLLLALFGDAAARLLDTLRGRGDEDLSGDAIDVSQSARIRELVRLVEGSDVGELTVEDGPLRITVRKQDERAPAPIFVPASTGPAPVNGETHEPEVSSAIRLESPMVGTFYRSPSPAQPAFVAEGDRVEVGQTLCILEAMKLFNEYKSDHAGIIRRILVENAQPVEYGQPLFELEPV
jgi:oxaloacetate decarboxylase alpha subunit